MKVIIAGDYVINFDNVAYITHDGRKKLEFIFNNSSGFTDIDFKCSIEEYQKIVDFIKNKDETYLEINATI